MELGSGVAIAGTVIAATVAILRLLPNKKNPNNYVLHREFSELKQFITNTLGELKKDIRGIHERIDKIIMRSP